MRRACKVTTKFITEKKKRALATLLQAYRAAVNFYINSLWIAPGRLDKDTLARLQNTRLSERYKSNALKQALETVVATKRSAHELGKTASCPVFNGSAILDSKFVSIEQGEKSFDLVVKISSLKKGDRITIPTRKTRPINKWLSQDGKFIQGCCFSENHLIIWIECKTEDIKPTGKIIGIDQGVNKLLADSDGAFYGKDFIPLRDKIKRRVPGSKGKLRAIRERENFINRNLNHIPWNDLKILGMEDLKNLKRGKRKDRGKDFRKAMTPWTYRRVLNRAQAKAEENRVRLVLVPPANTSRTCPICRVVSKKSRVGENFRCIACGHTQDADTVGALNVLALTIELTRSVESLVLPEVKSS
jgi:IS605 OrfB family transposase